MFPKDTLTYGFLLDNSTTTFISLPASGYTILSLYTNESARGCIRVSDGGVEYWRNQSGGGQILLQVPIVSDFTIIKACGDDQSIVTTSFVLYPRNTSTTSQDQAGAPITYYGFTSGEVLISFLLITIISLAIFNFFFTWLTRRKPKK